MVHEDYDEIIKAGYGAYLAECEADFDSFIREVHQAGGMTAWLEWARRRDPEFDAKLREAELRERWFIR